METHKNISAANMRNCRKCKSQEKAQENKTLQASTSTDPTPTTIIYYIIIKPINSSKRTSSVIHLDMPVTYVIDYGIFMI
jgi:hypothetical protein